MNAVHLSQVDLNLLVLFDAVTSERHLARAAARMGVSPSAASHGVARLRRLFGDPLFVRTPKGVMATERAIQLSRPIADILANVKAVVAPEPTFDPATSTRRFTLGMPDATAAVLLPRLLALTGRSAPLIDVGLRHVLPLAAASDLDSGAIDVAVASLDDLPARFVAHDLYEEEFVIVGRLGHPFLKRPTLQRYTEARHALVSTSGDAHGFVDDALQRKGVHRRVALVVSSFMLAMASLPNTDLLAALPRSLVTAHGARFRLGFVEAPFALRRYAIQAVARRAAMSDAGIAWLVATVARAAGARPTMGNKMPGAPPRERRGVPKGAVRS